MKGKLYKLVLRWKWEVCIVSDECMYIFVYFYCHLYYEENIKTTKLRRSFKTYTGTIPLFRPCLHVPRFVCIRRHFIAVTKLYASTRIRICCVFDRPHISEFDTRMFESLIEHALINKLRRLPWQRSKWVADFRTFTSSFSKVCCCRRPYVTGFVAFSKVCGYCVRFRRIRVDQGHIRNKMFADTNESGYVWTERYL